MINILFLSGSSSKFLDLSDESRRLAVEGEQRIGKGGRRGQRREGMGNDEGRQKGKQGRVEGREEGTREGRGEKRKELLERETL